MENTDMNSNQGTTSNNAFTNVPKKISFTKNNYSFSFPSFFFFTELKNKIISCQILDETNNSFSFLLFYSLAFIFYLFILFSEWSPVRLDKQANFRGKKKDNDIQSVSNNQKSQECRDFHEIIPISRLITLQLFWMCNFSLKITQNQVH